MQLRGVFERNVQNLTFGGIGRSKQRELVGEARPGDRPPRAWTSQA